MTKPVYDVTVFAEDEDGSREVIGKGFYHADNVLAAHNKARDEHWDERMTGHYLCTFRSEVIENPCWYCLEAEANGECDHCGIDVCETCHFEGACCDGD